MLAYEPQHEKNRLKQEQMSWAIILSYDMIVETKQSTAENIPAPWLGIEPARPSTKPKP